MNKYPVIVVFIACVLFVIGVVIGAQSSVKPVSAGGQVIHFNGQTLDLSGASNIMVHSSNEQRVFSADEQQGVVTQTTSIVTVTVWMKP